MNTNQNDRNMTLADLMNCNLEDIHLCHSAEEHELATIVELHNKTLTEKGKQDWSDVLNSKIERIYQGVYGLQIELSGIPAERLTEFSYMLAGYASSKDYDTWVRNDDQNRLESYPS